ncbi:MAG: hypothetical protein US48_C0017G0015 [Candidatus Levybacteria bacterium GW2011_GWA2_37_36]|nr:MAG: hypothetical protein US48_C0017G0015 [Candidatus Levybacteria bacterium GW2011_GWA2_37_36]
MTGTYLSGWDNLQTELNPWLAVKRAFFSVWEEYQSFGLTAGMAHAADLPRAIFLLIMSFLIPQDLIRYFYHFLMLLLGGLGAMKLIIGLDPRRSLSPNGGGDDNNDIFAFFGALFYIFNLGTVQIFYLPYEAFSTFFALLPWGIWIFSKLLSNGTIKQSNNWKLFFLINLLGTPAFYAQQLFIVYLLILFSFSIPYLVRNCNNSWTAVSKLLLLFCSILIINSFWLFPQLYFLKTNGSVVTEAKNNTLSTENVFYQNYEKATLNNFLRLEGFYFDLKGKNNTFLFSPWKDHFNGTLGLLPYAFAGLMILGLLKSVKEKEFSFLFIFLLCATGLLLATPPFSWVNELIRQIPVINQIFRSPFTKFIIPYSLVYSFFVAKGLQTLVPTQSGDTKNRNLFICLFVYLFIFFYSLPSFQGYFFSPEMKVRIPNDYQSVINYFKTEGKNSRITLLPDYTFWGWFFNKWGYNGSGFLWYGIEQPIISRTFDVWSKSSESYFWESKTAFEAEDINKLINVFDKYQIDYLLLDKSLVPVVSSYKALQYDRINELLLKSTNITPIFSGENIFLYKINHQYIIKNYVSLASNLVNITPQINVTNDDQAFLENGFYSTNQNIEPDIFYPFLSLTSQLSSKDKNWQISEDDDYFYLTTQLNFEINNFELFLNNAYEETIFINNEPIKVFIKIEPLIQGNNLTVKIEKKVIKNYDINLDQTTDFGFTDNTLSQNISYLLKIKSSNSQGLPLFFYIVDETKKQSYLEDRLDKSINYIVIQPRYSQGLGYTFAFQNKSFKNLSALNNLKELSLYLFPYQSLKEMKFVKNGFNKPETVFSNNFEVNKMNYFTYQVILPYSLVTSPYSLVLFQSYSPLLSSGRSIWSLWGLG